MFHDRVDAGRQLARQLVHLKGASPPVVVLGLPRGGVVVAAEVAKELHAPLDVLIVRKLGAPLQPELAIGAVTDGDKPQTVLNEDIIRSIGVNQDYIQEETKRQLEEVHQRQSSYRRGRPAVQVSDKTVVVIDDGIATGATIRAAITAVRRMSPKEIMLAVPVAAAEAIRRLSLMVDECVCLETPEFFSAVGRFYEVFGQTSDEEVISLIDDSQVH